MYGLSWAAPDGSRCLSVSDVERFVEGGRKAGHLVLSVGGDLELRD